MKSRTVRLWAFRLVGLALLGLLLSRIDFGHSLALIRRADPVVLVLATLLIFPMIALKTARWRWLQRSAGLPEVSYSRSYLAYFTGMYAGLVTPGRVGELVRVRYLTSRGAALAPAFSTVLWDRVIDVLGLFLMGLVALWPLAGEFRSLYLAVAAIVVGATALIVLLVWKGSPAMPAGTYGTAGAPASSGPGEGKGLAGLARRILPGLLESMSRLGFPSLAGLFGLTLAGWVLYYFQAWLIARTLGISLALLPLVVCVTAAAVAAFLPLSISGLGTRDAAMVVLFSRFGHPGEEALALSAVIFLVMVANALVGLLASQILEIRPAAPEANP